MSISSSAAAPLQVSRRSAARSPCVSSPPRAPASRPPPRAAGVDADLHEARLDPAAIDPCSHRDPARASSSGVSVNACGGRCLSRFAPSRRCSRGFGGPTPRPAAAATRRHGPGMRGALDQRGAAERLHLPQERQRPREDDVGVVAGRADLRGADEVDEHVLVHQRHAQLRGIDRRRHRLDRAPRGRLRPSRRRHRRAHHPEAPRQPLPVETRRAVRPYVLLP